jgi:hypothetical protein
MARASARLGRHELALGLYDRLGRRAMQAEDLLLVGRAMDRIGRSDAALEILRSAYRADPKNPEILDDYARLELRADALSAVAKLGEVMKRVPGWEARGAVVLGLARNRQDDAPGTISALEDALNRDRTLAGSWTTPAEGRKLLARAHLKLRRPDPAREQLHFVLGAGPDREASWLLSRAELQRGDLAAAATALAAAGDFGNSRPHAFEPAPFVGVSACVECHRDIHRLALGTRHSKTYRSGAALADMTLPPKPFPDPGDPKVVHRLSRRANRVELETHVDGRVRRALLEYALGSGDRGLTPVARDDAGQMRELRLSYYGDLTAWDRTMGRPEHPKERADFLGEPLSADSVRRCLGCHVTDYRETLAGIGPTVAEKGIGCERCHGPAGNHLLAVASKFPDPAIGRPRLSSPQQVTVELCGDCHRPRNRDVSPLDEDAVRFQAVTLTWSRCYAGTGAALGCVTCHGPHRDADTAPAHYEAKCLACHGPSAASGSGSAPDRQSRHVAMLPAGSRRVSCPVNARGDCIECHMPAVTTPAAHAVFTDHQIRVHREPSGTATGGESTRR